MTNFTFGPPAPFGLLSANAESSAGQINRVDDSAKPWSLYCFRACYRRDLCAFGGRDCDFLSCFRHRQSRAGRDRCAFGDHRLANRTFRRSALDRLGCGRCRRDIGFVGLWPVLAPRVAHSDPVVRAVATLGLALVILGIMEFFWGEYGRALRLPTDSLGIRILDVRVTYTRLIALGLTCVGDGRHLFFLGWTRMGLAMRAIANQREISALLGVPVLKVDSWAWVMSGLIAGVSGILLANLARMQPLFLTFMVIPAIAAAIAGRVQSLGVAVAGGLAIGVIEAIGTPFPSIAPYRTLTPFLFAIVALIWLAAQRRPLISLAERRAGSRAMCARAAPQGVRAGGIGCGIAAGVAAASWWSPSSMPELTSSYWLRILTASCHLVARRRLPSASSMRNSAWFRSASSRWSASAAGLRCASAMRPICPSRCRCCAAGVGAAAFGLIFGLPALRMRGLYLALTTLMIAGGFQVVITAIDFPDGRRGIHRQGHRRAAPYMGRPELGFYRRRLFPLLRGSAGHRLSHRFLAQALASRARMGDDHGAAKPARCRRASTSSPTRSGPLHLPASLQASAAGCSPALSAQLDLRSFPASDSILLFASPSSAAPTVGWGRSSAGLLLRAVPGVLNDLHIDGNVADDRLRRRAAACADHRAARRFRPDPRYSIGAYQGVCRAGATEEGGMIEIDGLEVRFGGVRAMNALTASLDAPVTGLIGPNGAGKTTLLNVLSGFITPTAGRVKIDGQDIARMKTHRRAAFGIRRTFQTEQVVLNLSVWDNVAAVLDHIPSERRKPRRGHHCRVCATPASHDRPHYAGRRPRSQRPPHGRDRPLHRRFAAPDHDGRARRRPQQCRVGFPAQGHRRHPGVLRRPGAARRPRCRPDLATLAQRRWCSISAARSPTARCSTCCRTRRCAPPISGKRQRHDAGLAFAA